MQRLWWATAVLVVGTGGAVEAGETTAPAVTIDLNVGASAINPRIYGQFIEHMGRCIYGGIWAEMLEDRKFFHPVAMLRPHGTAGTASPWKRVGPETKASIGMTSRRPYVGRWSVEIAAGEGVTSAVGIRHGGLGFWADREYTGYVIAEAEAAAAAAVTLEVTLGWGGGEGDRATVAMPLKS